MIVGEELTDRVRASYWLNKCYLSLGENDPENKIYYQAVDAFMKEDFEKAIKLAKKALKQFKSHMTLYVGR